MVKRLRCNPTVHGTDPVSLLCSQQRIKGTALHSPERWHSHCTCRLVSQEEGGIPADGQRSREKSGAAGLEGWRHSGDRVRGHQGSQNRLGVSE